MGRISAQLGWVCFVCMGLGLGQAYAQEGGALPNRTYTPDQHNAFLATRMGGEVPHNQPAVVNGWLMLAGNATFELWDISEPTEPIQLSTFVSEHNTGEAESHQVTFARTSDGRTLAATISGRGIDLWDVSDARAPMHLSHMFLEGVDYGDNSRAVWGIYWQGDFIYVGGTNTGLHIVDASTPEEPTLVLKMPTSEFGGVSAGPLWALGNLLVVTTPKNHAGVVTMDIGDPAAPSVLDVEIPEEDAYIGGFFEGRAYLVNPLRTYDVTTDPSNITLLGHAETSDSEYMSFGDGLMFMGSLRPWPGVYKVDISDPNAPRELEYIEGRRDDFFGGLLTDDQFSIPIGNLLVLSDDERDIGSALVVHSPQRDTTAPKVSVVHPPDGATRQPITTRIGVSFTDQIDLRSVTVDTLIVRPLGGGAPLTGTVGHVQTVVNFWPDAPLEPNTTYEVVLPVGGVTDLVGNALTEETRTIFSTGDNIAAAPCAIAPLEPVSVGAPAHFDAEQAQGEAVYRWDFGDGESSEGSTPVSSHTYQAPGRIRVTLTVVAPQGQRSCSALQIVHRPLAEPRPQRASSVVVDAERGQAWVVNPDADTITAVDLETWTPTREVPVGDQPETLAQGPDGTLWVVNQESDDIHLIDPDTGASQGTLALPWGTRPYGIAFSPDRTRAWVTLEGSGELAVIALDSRMVVATVPLGPDPRGIAVSDERVVVTRLISPETQGELYVVDPGQLDAGAQRIALAPSPGPDRADAGRGVPNYINSVAISPSGTRAWVTAKLDNLARGLIRDGEPLNTTNTVRTVVTEVDLVAGAEVEGKRFDLDDHNMAFAVALSPRGDLVFVASLGTHLVDVLDAYSGRRIAGIATGLAPQGLALTDGGQLVVHNLLSRTLSVFDVSGLLAGTDGAARPVAEVTTVEQEPLSPEVLLGKQIFYNADSRALSQDGYISCATCHLNGADDGQVWDFTDRGEGLRNTTDLRGRAGTAHGPLHWTANFDEVQDFENDIRNHFGGHGLMTDADFEADNRSDPLGGSKAGVSARLDALSAYVTTLDRYPKSPWRNADGTRTEAGERGYDLFLRLDCLDCHTTQTLTDSGTALHDVGTLAEHSGQRLGGELTGIDTPTLHGVYDTAPYFHDGSAPTLRDTLTRPGHGNAQGLTEGQLDDLVAFMLQLEGEPLGLERREPLPEPQEDTGLGGTDGDTGVGPDAMPDTGLPNTDAPTTRSSGGGGSSCAVWPGRPTTPLGTGLVLLLLGQVFVRRRRMKR